MLDLHRELTTTYAGQYHMTRSCVDGLAACEIFIIFCCLTLISVWCFSHYIIIHKMDKLHNNNACLVSEEVFHIVEEVH